MSAQAARHANRSGPDRSWVLVAAAVAYVALVLHAGMAYAYAPSSPASAPAVPSHEPTAGLHVSLPALPDPCCVQHACDTLAAVGPIVPGTRDRLARPPATSFAAVGRVAAPFPAWAGDPAARPATPSLTGARPVYLTSARIRL